MYRLCLNVLFCGALFLCACDLQPKITSIPDNIGMFIENRYPALLADPESQPEIYNAAVTDYGVYASPELYGSENIDDYVLYASVDDYVLVPEKDVVIETEKNSDDKKESVIIKKPDTKESDENTIEDEIMSEYLIVPVYGGNTVLDEIDNKEESQSKEEEKPEEKQIKKTAEIDVIKVADKKIEKPEDKPVSSDVVIVAKGDTLYSLAKKNNTTIAELAKINNLKEPYALSIGQKLSLRAPKTVETKIEKPVKKPIEKPIPNVISEEKVKQIKAEKTKQTVVKETVKPTSTKRVDVEEITVAKGDTLYSLSRKYEIPVNDLAVMNKLSAPFTLSVGQKIKVPKLKSVKTKPAVVEKKVEQTKTAKSEKKPDTKVQEKPKETKKSVETKNTTQKIAARSSSKFSWPVRGTILSGYGPKNGGLVNDGINISAPLGTIVKAAENGVVAYAGNEVKGMGNLIIIQHSDGWMTVYAHLNSMDVRRGTRVSVGQAIGKIGKTGKVDKPQLHFEIRKGTKSYNPTNYLKK